MLKDDWDDFIGEIEPCSSRIYDSHLDILSSRKMPKSTKSYISKSYAQKMKNSVLKTIGQGQYKLSPSKGNSPVYNNYKVKEYKDNRLLQQLENGKLKIDDVLDFHNSTTDMVKDRLHYFLVRSYNRDLRRVLIITGKSVFNHNKFASGDIMPNLTIRRLVMQLLEYNDFAQYVRGYIQAPEKLGGEGAFCVFIRRYKSQF